MLEILFQYGPISIRTFNLFLAAAFLLGTYLLLRFISRNKLSATFLTRHFIWLLLLPLIGGRLFYLIEHASVYLQNPLPALYLWDLKYSGFGMLYTFLATLYFFTRKEDKDFWLWLDGFSIAGLGALILINIGHFFNGSNYGKPTEMPWGISFDTINIPFTTPIHPTQLYLALAATLIYAFIVRYNRRTHLSGMVGTLAIMLYSLSAFGVNFLQGASAPYSKINLGLIAALAFIGYIHTSHKSHLVK